MQTVIELKRKDSHYNKSKPRGATTCQLQDASAYQIWDASTFQSTSSRTSQSRGASMCKLRGISRNTMEAKKVASKLRSNTTKAMSRASSSKTC